MARGFERTAASVAADVYPISRPGNAKSETPTSKRGSEERLQTLGARLKELVKQEKLTADEAIELYQAAANAD